MRDQGRERNGPGPFIIGHEDIGRRSSWGGRGKGLRARGGGGEVVGAPFSEPRPPLQGLGDGDRTDHPKGPRAILPRRRGCVCGGG